MNPKERAKLLFHRNAGASNLKEDGTFDSSIPEYHAIFCAQMCVHEILMYIIKNYKEADYNYWKEVQSEIEKL